MNYKQSLQQFRSSRSRYGDIADQITERAISGGLGGRPRRLIKEEDKPKAPVSGLYAFVAGLSGDSNKEEDTYSELAPMESERPPEGTVKTDKVRPRGRGEIPKGEVQDYILEGLISRGIPEHVAQGMLMNIADESGFKKAIEEYEPNVHGTKGKGLYQLTGDRREAFEAKFGDDYSIDNQLDWLVHEFNTTEKSAFEKILATETAGEAGAAIVTHFLRPAAKHRKARVQKYMNSVPYLRT